MVAKLKIWDGLAWVEKVFSAWTGAAFEQKPAYYWGGSKWILIGGAVWPGFTATLAVDGTFSVIENIGGGSAVFTCTGTFAVS